MLCQPQEAVIEMNSGAQVHNVEMTGRVGKSRSYAHPVFMLVTTKTRAWCRRFPGRPPWAQAEVPIHLPHSEAFPRLLRSANNFARRGGACVHQASSAVACCVHHNSIRGRNGQ